MEVKDIARICHGANKTLCATQGDNSQVHWNDAPDWQKDSVIAGVKFCLENPDAPASANHDSWLAVKEAEGWVFGEEKDVEKKTHPCMVPYEQLPAAQKAKDHLFKAVVGALSGFVE